MTKKLSLPILIILILSISQIQSILEPENLIIENHLFGHELGTYSYKGEGLITFSQCQVAHIEETKGPGGYIDNYLRVFFSSGDEQLYPEYINNRFSNSKVGCNINDEILLVYYVEFITGPGSVKLWGEFFDRHTGQTIPDMEFTYTHPDDSQMGGLDCVQVNETTIGLIFSSGEDPCSSVSYMTYDIPSKTLMRDDRVVMFSDETCDTYNHNSFAEITQINEDFYVMGILRYRADVHNDSDQFYIKLKADGTPVGSPVLVEEERTQQRHIQIVRRAYDGNLWVDLTQPKYGEKTNPDTILQKWDLSTDTKICELTLQDERFAIILPLPGTKKLAMGTVEYIADDDAYTTFAYIIDQDDCSVLERIQQNTNYGFADYAYFEDGVNAFLAMQHFYKVDGVRLSHYYQYKIGDATKPVTCTGTGCVDCNCKQVCFECQPGYEEQQDGSCKKTGGDITLPGDGGDNPGGPRGYFSMFMSDGSIMEAKCAMKCASCEFSSENCLTCQIQENRLQEYPCDCVDGFYDLNGECVPCPGKGCRTCEDGTGNCKECIESEKEYAKEQDCIPCYFYQGTCVERCPTANKSRQKLRDLNKNNRQCEDDEDYTAVQITVLAVVGVSFMVAIGMAIAAKTITPISKHNEKIDGIESSEQEIDESSSSPKMQQVDESSNELNY